jgi:Kef-type K+ transport system membrane component KefB
MQEIYLQIHILNSKITTNIKNIQYIAFFLPLFFLSLLEISAGSSKE